jgi:hypothetical protein
MDSLSAIFTALIAGIAPDNLSRTWKELITGGIFVMLHL